MKAICEGTQTRNDVVQRNIEQYRAVFARTSQQMGVLKAVREQFHFEAHMWDLQRGCAENYCSCSISSEVIMAKCRLFYKGASLFLLWPHLECCDRINLRSGQMAAVFGFMLSQMKNSTDAFVQAVRKYILAPRDTING